MTNDAVAVIYRPDHIRQRLRYGGRLIGCTETCLAMYADAVTFGGLTTSEAECRALSGEVPPDPASPGLNLRQIDQVAAKLRIQFRNATGEAWPDVERYLSTDDNRRIIAQVWYDAMPGGTPIGHALLLQGIRSWQGRIRLFGNDPLRNDAEWWEVADVRRAMEEFGKRTDMPRNDDGDQTLRFGVSDMLPFMARIGGSSG